jgi:hypothetical protein
MVTRWSALAGVGAALTMMASGVGPAAAAPRQMVQCMTDDGYGRLRPCSASYKREHPNWRAGDECMTDDGYGRLRPCSALYKQKIDKSKQ